MEKQPRTPRQVLGWYTIVAIAFTILAALFWTLGPHSSHPFSDFLARFGFTVGGPISLWVVRDLPILDVSTLTFLVICGMVQAGVMLGSRLPGRILGALGVVVWFLIGLGVAALTVK